MNTLDRQLGRLREVYRPRRVHEYHAFASVLGEDSMLAMPH